MADLKPLGRQVGQPSAPDISNAAKAVGTGAAILNAGAQAVGDIVKKRRDAALEMEATFNVLTAQREMNMNVLKLKQKQNANDEDLAELNYTNQEIAKRILQNTSKENQADVSKKVLGFAIKAEASAFDYVGDSKKRQIKDAGASTLYEGGKQLEEAARLGDDDGFQITFNQIDKSQQALLEAGYISQEDYLKNRENLIQLGINGKLQYEYEKALTEGGERAGVKYIENFWNTELNMTQAQKDAALKSLIEVRGQNKSAELQVGQAGFRDVMSAITSETPPANEAELQTLIDNAAERGFPLNEYQAYKALQAFRKSQNKKNTRIQNNILIAKEIASGDTNALINRSASEIDSFYIDTRKQLMEQAQEQTQSLGTEGQKIMAQRAPWMIGATIASQTPVPIPQWQDEIHSQIVSSNPEDNLAAVSAYNFVAKQNPRAIDGISSKDQSFLRAINSDLQNTSLTKQEIIDKYKDTILNVDPKVQENRVAAYKEIIKDNPGLPDSIAKKAFGKNIDNKLLQPGADLYAAAQNAFEREYMLTGDKNQAVSNAVSYLKDNGGKSLFAPKGEPVWNPPENLPFYEFGNIVRNQATKYLREAVDGATKHPGKLPYTLEWSDKMPEFPPSVSQEDLFKNEYDKGEWWLKINGTDRRVYFISPNYNQANSFAETKYQVMYEKDGYLHNLMTVGPTLGPDGQIDMRANTSLMTFLAPNQLTPDLVKSMQEESAQRAKGKYIEKEIGFPTGIFEPDYSEYLQKAGNKEKREKAIKIIEEQNKDLPARIEKEKLRRQQDTTKEAIKGPEKSAPKMTAPEKKKLNKLNEYLVSYKDSEEPGKKITIKYTEEQVRTAAEKIGITFEEAVNLLRRQDGNT